MTRDELVGHVLQAEREADRRRRQVERIIRNWTEPCDLEALSPTLAAYHAAEREAQEWADALERLTGRV
jgi:hypothetical protein